MDLSSTPVHLGVELFSTSSGHNIKTKKDCYRLRSLLDVKKISYIEVDLALQVWRRREMLKRSGGVDVLPQLHANGKFIGDIATVQDLEDHGELEEALQLHLPYSSPVSSEDESTQLNGAHSQLAHTSIAVDAATSPRHAATQARDQERPPVTDPKAGNSPEEVKQDAEMEARPLQNGDGAVPSRAESSADSVLEGTMGASSMALMTDKSSPESGPITERSSLASGPESKQSVGSFTSPTLSSQEFRGQSSDANELSEQPNDVVSSKEGSLLIGQALQEDSGGSNTQEQDVGDPDSPRTPRDQIIKDAEESDSCGSFVRGSDLRLKNPFAQHALVKDAAWDRGTPKSDSLTGQGTSNTLVSESSSRRLKSELLPANTATRDALAHTRHDSQISSADSTLAGTISDSDGSGSWEETQPEASLKRASPRVLLQEALSSRSLASEIQLGRASNSAHDSPRSYAETESVGSEILNGFDATLNPSLKLNIDAAVRGSILDSQEQSFEATERTDSLSNQISQRSLPEAASDLDRQETARGISSITEAIEASQQRLADGAYSDTASELSLAAQMSLLDSLPHDFLPVKSTAEQLPGTQPQSVNSSPPRDIAPGARDGSANTETHGNGETDSQTHQARLSELDVLLSTSMQLSKSDIALGTLPEPEPDQDEENSGLGNGWEFVKESLSSQVQSMKEAAGNHQEGSVNKAWAIASESSASLEDLLADVSSHQINDWKSDSCESSPNSLLNTPKVSKHR